MRLTTVQRGDTIKCNVRGTTFPATFKGVDDNGLVRIQPLDPKHFTWRRVTARQVVERVEVRQALGVAS